MSSAHKPMAMVRLEITSSLMTDSIMASGSRMQILDFLQIGIESLSLKTTLEKLGFTNAKIEHLVYIKTSDDGIVQFEDFTHHSHK